jgi:hypothetical protein
MREFVVASLLSGNMSFTSESLAGSNADCMAPSITLVAANVQILFTAEPCKKFERLHPIQAIDSNYALLFLSTACPAISPINDSVTLYGAPDSIP